MSQRSRRSFTSEQKCEAVGLVWSGGRSAYRVAWDLGLSETALRCWVEDAEVNAGRGAPSALMSAEREELTRPRRENSRLEMEREFLKKVQTGYTGNSLTGHTRPQAAGPARRA